MQKRPVAIFTTICLVLSLVSGMVFTGTAESIYSYTNSVELGNGTGVYVVPEPDCADTLIDDPCYERHEYTLSNDTYHYVSCDTDDAHNKREAHHNVNEEIKPTCDGAGYLRRECTLCGNIYEKTYPALGHDWGVWTEGAPAEETEPVERYRECNECHTVQYWKSDDPAVVFDAEFHEDETITLTASLKNNPGISAFEIKVDYDPSIMEIDASSYKAGSVFTGVFCTKNINEEFIKLAWSPVTADDIKVIETNGILFSIRFKVLKSGTVYLSNTVGASVSEGEFSKTVTVFVQDYEEEFHVHEYEWESVPKNYICECGRVQSTGVVDVDGDGHLTSNDATVIMRHVVNKEFPYMNQNGADYNKDGKISLGDAVAILRKLVE